VSIQDVKNDFFSQAKAQSGTTTSAKPF